MNKQTTLPVLHTGVCQEVHTAQETRGRGLLAQQQGVDDKLTVEGAGPLSRINERHPPNYPNLLDMFNKVCDFTWISLCRSAIHPFTENVAHLRPQKRKCQPCSGLPLLPACMCLPMSWRRKPSAKQAVSAQSSSPDQEGAAARAATGISGAANLCGWEWPMTNHVKREQLVSTTAIARRSAVRGLINPGPARKHSGGGR